jgi:ribonuclease Z
MVLEFGDTRLLIDCGDGTLERLKRGRIGLKLNGVLLTSATAFETAGLGALAEVRIRVGLSTLQVFGPPSSDQVLADVAAMYGRAASELFDIQVCEGNESIPIGGDVYLAPFRLSREPGNVGLGWDVFEIRRRRFIVERATRAGLEGVDFARIERGETVRGVRPDDVLGPPMPGCKVVAVGRTRPSPEVEAALEGADVATLAAPFMDERLEVAQSAYALTGWEAAELCAKARVKLVTLTDVAPYGQVAAFIEEARQFHPRVYVPNDGDDVRLPMPEAGGPFIVRDGADRRPTRRGRAPTGR